MKTEQSKALVRRMHKEIFQQGNLDLVDELIADDYVVHQPDGDQSRDEHFNHVIPAFAAAFPDMEFIFYDTFAEGDKVASRFEMRGTHKGEFMGVPPTGKRVSMSGIVLERVEDGKVAESWVERDNLGLLQQIGVVPEPA